MFKEIVLGFDARAMSEGLSADLEKWRAAGGLLNPEVERPLTTDYNIWPDVFHVLNIPVPEWTGPRQGSWQDLDELKIFLSQQTIDIPYWLVAITQFVQRSTASILAEAFNIRPDTLSPEWTLLGYDVSDYYYYSGLTNMGEIRLEPKMHPWASQLNEYHLFTNATMARHFSQISDQRADEHSPFYVFGIYLIEKREPDHSAK